MREAGPIRLGLMPIMRRQLLAESLDRGHLQQRLPMGEGPGREGEPGPPGASPAEPQAPFQRVMRRGFGFFFNYLPTYRTPFSLVVPAAAQLRHPRFIHVLYIFAYMHTLHTYLGT